VWLEGLSNEKRDKVRELSRRLFDLGEDPREVLGLTDEGIEGLYATAHNFFQGGNHEMAAHFFRILALISPRDPRFYLGIGASLHEMKQYENACFFYKIASGLDPTNPLIDFYQYDCRIRLNQKGQAIDCLKSVIRKGSNTPSYQTIVDRAILTLAQLQ
jgi:type III secretion system low calcium response chaperone LcrH/SycD